MTTSTLRLENPEMTDDTNRASSSISDDILIDGNLQTSGKVRIGGTVNGDVSAGDLVLEQQGKIKGKVTAEKAELRGNQQGKVQCRTLSIASSAIVRGDIKCDDLVVEFGAEISGKVHVKPK